MPSRCLPRSILRFQHLLINSPITSLESQGRIQAGAWAGYRDCWTDGIHFPHQTENWSPYPSTTSIPRSLPLTTASFRLQNTVLRGLLLTSVLRRCVRWIIFLKSLWSEISTRDHLSRKKRGETAAFTGAKNRAGWQITLSTDLQSLSSINWSTSITKHAFVNSIHQNFPAFAPLAGDIGTCRMSILLDISTFKILALWAY